MDKGVITVVKGNIDFGKFKATPIGLVVKGKPSFEEWSECGEILQRFDTSRQWLIGDWSNFGDGYGEVAAQAIAENLDYGALRVARFVCNKFKLLRRRNNLSFAHHQDVASINDEKEQDRLLDIAEKEGLTEPKFRKRIKQERRDKALESAGELPSFCEVIEADFSESDIKPESIDAIITDPPYPEEYLQLYEKLGPFASKVLKPGGSLVVMSGQSYLPQIYAVLGESLTYYWTFAYLTPGGQSAQLWNQKINTFWKPLLWYVKGQYAGDEWKGDVLKSDENDKSFHEWGQSEGGMAEIVNRFSKPGDTILDPFCGAGTTGIATLKLKRKFIGIEIDSKTAEIAKKRLAQYGS